MVDTRFELSRHAERRCQQRGITREVLAVVLEEADQVRPVGGEGVARYISKRRRRQLVQDGRPPQLIEKTRSLCAVTAGEQIVTVFHGCGRRARPYWRGRNN